MKIRFACPTCAKAHAVDASLAGKKGRCKDCGSVMRIPDAPRAAVASPSAVIDPFGLDDDAGYSPPLPPIGTPIVDDGEPSPSLRRPGTTPGAKKRRASQGPWNLPLRGLAVNLMALSLIVSIARNGLSRTPATAGASKIASILWFIIALPGAALTIASVVGAVVSFAKGNRKAFSGESIGGQFAWCYAIGQTLVIAWVLTFLLQPGGMARLATLGRSLSTTQKAELFVYEDLVGSTETLSERLATIYDGFPNIDPDEVSEIMGRFRDQQGRAETTPLPTFDQVRFLRARYEIPIRMAVDRLDSSSRVLRDRLKADPVDKPEFAAALADVDKMVSLTTGLKAELERLRPSDDLAWYLTVTSNKAGTRTADAPRTRPGEIPPEVIRHLDEPRRRMEDFHRQFNRPPVVLPGAPAVP